MKKERAFRMTLEFECEFNLWWDKYPRKVGRVLARQKFITALNNGATIEELHDGLGHYNAWLKQERTAQRYILHASTWLHQERWTDEHEIDPVPMWKRPYEEWTAEEKQETHRMLDMGFPPANLRITAEQAGRLRAEFADNVVRLEA